MTFGYGRFFITGVVWSAFLNGFVINLAGRRPRSRKFSTAMSNDYIPITPIKYSF